MSNSYHEELGRAVAADSEAGGFLGSILAGFFLGLGLDSWLGTRPSFIIAGIIIGSVSGFWKLWQLAKRRTQREQQDAERH
ncbi:MAG: AtpZ/AtpI family protein [Acidimicrobiia bacterium]